GLCAAALSAGVAHPAQAQTPNLAVGETVAAVGKTYAFSAASPSAPAIGDEAPGNRGVVIAGPANNPYTQWQVAFSPTSGFGETKLFCIRRIGVLVVTMAVASTSARA